MAEEGDEEINVFEAILGFKLPESLRTVHNVRRWTRLGNSDEESIKSFVSRYLEYRNAIGTENVDLLRTFMSNENVDCVIQYIRLSVKPMVVNTVDNSVVLICQPDKTDYHALASVITCRQLSMFYATLGEYFLQQVMTQEERSGKESGVTVIYDLEDFRITDYLNPYSPIIQMFRIGIALLQEYYIELLRNLIIVNSGSVVRVFLQLAKVFLLPKAFEKIQIISDRDMKESLLGSVSSDALPSLYGGSWKELDVENVNPLSCCTINRPIPEAAASCDIQAASRFSLGAGKTYSAKISATEGQTLRWIFKTSGKTEFAVTFTDPKGNGEVKLLIPRLCIVTPLPDKAPEVGSIHCKESGVYSLEFRNLKSTFFSVKISYGWVLE
ncbi:CRAL TRIO domain containing protein [Trichuris trichiura]|uniref:CRAL TRIO domain containing protein n=1 Tax=Trichuris trichiura TaxID=36087 RepID=A0A077Z2J2_TRITR|nr:CRAL TRIO domain containing protein [Trichuris trichiura]